MPTSWLHLAAQPALYDPPDLHVNKVYGDFVLRRV
jgi:hypothetical protein